MSSAERPARIHRQERHLDPDPFQGHAGVADQADGPRDGIDRAVGLGPNLRNPRRRHGTLVGLQPVPDIHRVLRCALGIDQNRQIAADAKRIHVVEEDRALGTQQVLHIVLGGRDQDVEAGGLHQTVEFGGIEWNGPRAVCAGDVLLHDEPPNAAVASTAASVCPGIVDGKCEPREGFWVGVDLSGLICTAISMIRIRYIMEYLYIQSDQLFSLNSSRCTFVPRPLPAQPSHVVAAFDGYCAWGCFRVFESGPCLRKPILP
ncbi:hypothetical protein ACVWZW_001769 [Bradyrhizobium sp. F1.13.4]